MAYPVSSPKILIVANNIDAVIENISTMSASALASAQSSDYGELLNLPRYNITAQSKYADAIALGKSTEIVEQLSLLRAEPITVSDVAGVFSAFDSLCTLIENNESVFDPVINPTTKKIEFTQPVSSAIQTAIENSINSVLASFS